MLAYVLLLSAAPPTVTDHRPLQVGMIIDESALAPPPRPQDWRRRVRTSTVSRLPPGVVADLSVLQQIVLRRRPRASFAFGRCVMTEEQPGLQKLSDFKARPAEAAAVVAASAALVASLQGLDRRCAGRSEVYEEALEVFGWRPDVERHLVVVVGDHATMKGRLTLADIAATAEHLGVVVHVIETDDRSAVAAAERLTRAIDWFRAHPSWPRAERGWRGLALLTGGQHVVAAFTEKADKQRPSAEACERLRTKARGTRSAFGAKRRRTVPAAKEDRLAAVRAGCMPLPPDLVTDAVAEERRKLGLDGLFGRRDKRGRDGLHAVLARRRWATLLPDDRRPSFLVGVSLEPILDRIHDFVDARQELDDLATKRAFAAAAGGGHLPAAGGAVGAAIVAGARPMPSKR